MGKRDSSNILPSQREAVLPSAKSQGSGDGLQISLDLEDMQTGEDPDADWEDVDHIKTSGSQEQDKVSPV